MSTYLCSYIQNMKSLETHEWKVRSQSCSLHILMWNTNNEQTLFIKDDVFGSQSELVSSRVREHVRANCL